MNMIQSQATTATKYLNTLLPPKLHLSSEVIGFNGVRELLLGHFEETGIGISHHGARPLLA